MDMGLIPPGKISAVEHAVVAYMHASIPLERTQLSSLTFRARLAEAPNLSYAHLVAICLEEMSSLLTGSASASGSSRLGQRS